MAVKPPAAASKHKDLGKSGSLQNRTADTVCVLNVKTGDVTGLRPGSTCYY